jgi:hypothetical protein
MGSIAVTAPEDWGFIAGSTLYAGIVNGYAPGFGTDITSTYIGVTMNTPVANLKVGASFDYLGTTSFDQGADNYANAWALYTSFQATEKLSLHVRGEYASTDTGLLGGGTFGPGDNEEMFALTGTVQYDLWKNVLSRLEIRWDHQAGDGGMTGYGDNTDKRNNVLIAGNIIYKF